jgi:hypothetical protein
MIDKLYNKYFQKSKSFLYPALGIKKSTFGPENTYLSIEGVIPPEDMKLICVFKKSDTEKFKVFEEQQILTNPLYVKKINTESKNIYVFDLYLYKDDWLYFMLGKYSKFSTVLRRAIRMYYGENSGEYKYLHSFLNPEEYFNKYADLLQMDVDVLKNVGELCNPCNKDKETLKISLENLEVLQENQ